MPVILMFVLLAHGFASGSSQDRYPRRLPHVYIKQELGKTRNTPLLIELAS